MTEMQPISVNILPVKNSSVVISKVLQSKGKENANDLSANRVTDKTCKEINPPIKKESVTSACSLVTPVSKDSATILSQKTSNPKNCPQNVEIFHSSSDTSTTLACKNDVYFNKCSQCSCVSLNIDDKHINLLLLQSCSKCLEIFLDVAYNASSHQVGYHTDGHDCLNKLDIKEACNTGNSLLYGEVLPQGVSDMLNSSHLQARNSSSLFDLGMGTGKLALQAFLQYSSLRRVVGIEIAFSRYQIGESALLNIVSHFPKQFAIKNYIRGFRVAIKSLSDGRTLEFLRGDLFNMEEARLGDIVIVQTDFPSNSYDRLLCFLSNLQRSAKLLTYMYVFTIIFFENFSYGILYLTLFFLVKK